MILHRLLQDVDPDSYLLIANRLSQDQRKDSVATQPLGARAVFVEAATSHPLLPYGRRNLVRFPFIATQEIRGRVSQIDQALADTSCECLITCTGDFYDFVACYIVARRRGMRFVPYLFDDFMYQATEPIRLIAWLVEKVILRSSSAIIVTNELAAEVVKKRHGVSATVIHNAFELPAIPMSPASKLDPSLKHIVFAGTIYEAHYDAFLNLLRAIELLMRNDIRLHLFTSSDPDELKAHGISGPCIDYHGFLSQDESLAAQRQADLLFLPLAFRSTLSPLLKTAAPGKMAEYLSIGKPVLVHAPADSFVAWYFKNNDCGIVVEQNDVTKLSAAITEGLENQELRSKVVANATQLARTDFSLSHARKLFEKISL